MILFKYHIELESQDKIFWPDEPRKRKKYSIFMLANWRDKAIYLS